MNKQLLAQKLWDSANELRGKMDASEYKNYILGLLFYKFLSEHEENYLRKYETSIEELDSDTIQTVKEDLGYFIGKEDLYSTWIQNIKGAKWSITHVTDALGHFRENILISAKHDFDGIFEDVNLTSEKLGSNIREKEFAIRKLLELLASVNIAGNKEYDTFGFIYEYLIAKFAMSSGKKAGEFYTPHEVSQIMAAIVAKHLKTKEKSMVYDPTVGSGSLLLTVREATQENREEHTIKFYGQENNSTTYNIARMNLLMRGVKPANMKIRNGDTLKEDWPHGIINGVNDPLHVDVVVANPPYSQKWEGDESSLKDPRFRDYGVAPSTKADYAFLLHSLYHLRPDGVMAIVLPHGVLFRGNEEEKIRTKLLERGQIDAIIGLPAGIFTNTGIPTIIMVLNKTKKQDNVLFIDASKGFKKEKSSNVLRARDRKKILDAYEKRTKIEGFAHLATLAEIKENGYNLNIPRYVNSNEAVQEESIEGHLQGGIPDADINQFHRFWNQFPNLKEKLFLPLRPGFVTLAIEGDQIRETIQSDSNYQDFVYAMNGNIGKWEKTFLKETIQDFGSKTLPEIFKELEDQLFTEFSKSAFTDPYEAYQLFADQWNGTIEIDLEMISLWGLEKARELEPNMVVKVKNGKKEEVQEGLKGSILPKELIAQHFLKEELEKLETMENELASHEARQEELIEEINEESALFEFLQEKKEENDKNKLDASSYKNIKTRMGELKKSKEPEDQEAYQALEETYRVNETIKELRPKIKKAKEQLNDQVEAYYPKLSTEEIKTLLEKKWLAPLSQNLTHMIDTYGRKIATSLKNLDRHYGKTLSQIQEKRKQAEADFWAMASQLVKGEK